MTHPERSTLLARCADHDPNPFFEIAAFLGTVQGEYVERAAGVETLEIDGDAFVGDWVWALQSADAPVRVHIAKGTRLEDAVRLLKKLTHALEEHPHILEADA